MYLIVIYLRILKIVNQIQYRVSVLHFCFSYYLCYIIFNWYFLYHNDPPQTQELYLNDITPLIANDFDENINIESLKKLFKPLFIINIFSF